MESLAYTAITLRARQLHAATPDPRKDAAVWQKTLHDELGSGDYKDMIRRIGAQTENCPPDPSITELARRLMAYEYYEKPGGLEEPELPLHDITQRLWDVDIITDFETPEGLDYLKTLASITCGVNMTLELGMAKMHQDEVMDILRQTLTELEARRNIAGDSVLFTYTESQYEMLTAFERAHRRIRGDFEGKTLTIRLKYDEV